MSRRLKITPLRNEHVGLRHHSCCMPTAQVDHESFSICNKQIYRVGQKRGYKHMTVILSIPNRFKTFLLEDFLVNLQLNGYQKSHRTLHMLLHYLVKQNEQLTTNYKVL